jgi:hypothetical protein
MPVQDPTPPGELGVENENLSEEILSEVNEDDKQDVDPEVEETNENNGE